MRTRTSIRRPSGCAGTSCPVPNGPEPVRLSAAQREAVLAPDGPLLIVAGPGAGKTGVLAARIAHLVADRRIDPARILALTFSVKAAHELRLRIAAWLGARATAVDVSTFHAFGLRVARVWSRALGFTAGPPRVASALAAQTLLREAAAALGLAEAADPVLLAHLAATIDDYRLGHGTAPGSGPLPALAAAYEERLRVLGLVDFPGMLTLPLSLFARHPPALRHYQAAYEHLLVDELQDVCPVQAALLRLLAAGSGNLAVVGDPMQALYGWRGADGRFLRDFARLYPVARVVRLAENFRSTGHIVALANALGSALPYGQCLSTANPDGIPVVHYAACDETDEAAFVAAETRRLLGSGALAHPGEVAVLARTNQQLATLVPALRAHGLPATRREEDDTGGRVQLTTIHRAKGAEWRTVFVTGWEEGLLPHYRALGAVEPTALVGEHHVAFVAVTRPHERLYLTSCRQRATREGESPRPCAPSRFLAAMAAAPESVRALVRPESDERAA